MIIKPDTIAPIPAVINRIDVQDSVLKIVWTNSDSDDIKSNYLVKYFKSRTDTLSTWNNDLNEYVDTSIVGGNYYHYGIITKDKSDNTSSSKAMTQYFEPGYRKKMSNFEAKTDMESKAIILTWDEPNDAVYSYQIMRGKSGEKLLHLKTITDDSMLKFEDKNVYINSKYVYSIKYVNQEGIHSIPARAEVIYQ